MARKSKKNLDGTEEILPEEPRDLPGAAEESPVQDPEVIQEPRPEPRPAPVHEPVKAPAATVQAPVRKKRVRIRKKTTKHLSVAVLCTNPVTRRFI